MCRSMILSEPGSSLVLSRALAPRWCHVSRRSSWCHARSGSTLLVSRVASQTRCNKTGTSRPPDVRQSVDRECRVIPGSTARLYGLAWSGGCRGLQLSMVFVLNYQEHFRNKVRENEYNFKFKKKELKKTFENGRIIIYYFAKRKKVKLIKILLKSNLWQQRN